MIKGQAEGAGISFEQAFALRCTLELGTYFPMLSALCTSFAVGGEETSSGKTILGQNIDWYPVSSRPAEGYPCRWNSSTHIVSGWFLRSTSLSSAGFGMCANSTMTPVEGFASIFPLACYPPKAMRQKNIGDALGVLCQAARGIGYFHLASAEGDIVGIESVFDDFEIIYPHRGVLGHSNHYLTGRFKKGDLAYMGIPDSYLRLPRMQTLLEAEYGQITVEKMMAILADH